MIRCVPIFILLLLAGCAAPAPKQLSGKTGQLPPNPGLASAILPPMPTVARKAASIVAPPPPVRMVTLTASAPVLVQASTDLRNWLVFTNASTNGVTFKAVAPLQLFRGVLTNSRVSLAWNPSPDVNVAGYKIYYGPEPRAGYGSHGYSAVMDVGNVTSCTLNATAFPTNYFAATCYDATGVESDFSNEAVYSFPKPILTLK